MVVQHLGLVDAVDRVELVLSLCGQICSSLLSPPPLLGAPEEHGHNQDQKWDQSGEGGDQHHLAALHLVGDGALELEDGPVGKDVAVLAGVAWEALALEVVQFVDAEPVHAGSGGALVDLLAAVLAGEPGLAGTDEVIDRVVAGSAVGTGIGQAVVDILLAVSSDKAGVTVALVVVDEIEAGSAVGAGVSGAVIHVDLAVPARESRGTTALVLFPGDESTSAAILAGRGSTVVNLHVAVHTLKLGVTFALVSAVLGVGASGPILAGVVRASLGMHLAVESVEAKGTDAHVIVLSSALQR